MKICSKHLKLLALSFLILSSTKSLADGEERLTGTWQNQRGSILELKVGPQGSITGYMKSAVGSKLVTESAAPFNVVGHANGTLVSLAVSWAPASGAVSTLVGEFKISETGQYQIRSSALTKLSLKAEDQWQNTVLTEDIFTKITDETKKK